MAGVGRREAERTHAQPRLSLIREPLNWNFSPADVLRLVRADAHPAALFGAWAGGSDVVCSEPIAIRSDPAQPWEVLDESWPSLAAADPDGSEGSAFGGGWLGYLGYGLARVLPVPPAPGGDRRLPLAWLAYYDHVLRRNRASGRWVFEALATPERLAALDARLADLRDRASAASQARLQPRPYRCGEFGLIPDAAEHRSAVRRAVDYIWRGDIFQANICLRLEADFDGDPLDAFCAAASALDPPYAAFLRPSSGAAVASLSPELFLRRAGSAVSSRPIKGTCARPPDNRDAEAARARLERSAKNRAENVMIVDLMRNDLSRVSKPGSVVVPRLVAAESHPGVWHLVSEVRGEMRAGIGDGELVRAAFPPGSVTGAPKVRALEVIHELEATPREVYTGAVGYRSPIAGLELNVAIRTFEFHSGRVWLGAGGGIVAESRPAAEYRECLIKAAPLIAALGGAITRRTGSPAGPDPTKPDPAKPNPSEPDPAKPNPAEPNPTLRPRPAAGVFTSLLVRDGVTYRLAEHLDRLADSARLLYGKDLPASLGNAVARCLADQPSGRLRVAVRPLGGPLHATVEVVPVGESVPVVDLVRVVVPSGVGAHKWSDRRLLAHLAAAVGAADGMQLLIEDRDGQMLETDRANVFAMIGEALCTPRADGRLLAGVTRAAVLRLAAAAGLRIETGPMSRHDLASASEVFVTNSVRGVVPVRSVDGATLTAAPGPVTTRLAVALAADAADTPDTADPAATADPVHTAIPADTADTTDTADGTAVARRAATDRRRPGAAAAVRLAPAEPPGISGRPRSAARAPTVVMIDNYDSFTFNLVHHLAKAGCAVEVVRNDEVTAEQVVGLDAAGVVISPGPCAPTEAGISIDVVRACAAAPGGIPVLGVCLGHQAIGAAFGASIVPAPRPVHGQTSVITHGGGGVLAGLPRRFTATRYHSLVVAEPTLPGCLEITARTSRGLPMGLRHATLPIEGVQFHPESILTRCGQTIITTFADALRR